jgi:hypothetical protein
MLTLNAFFVLTLTNKLIVEAGQLFSFSHQLSEPSTDLLLHLPSSGISHSGGGGLLGGLYPRVHGVLGSVRESSVGNKQKCP